MQKIQFNKIFWHPMKIKYRLLKIIITVVTLIFLLNFSLKKFNNRTITDRDIVVNFEQTIHPVYFISQKEIVNIVKKQNPRGKIKDINIPKLEREVRAFPAVDSANVYLNLSGRLNVDIKQKVPIFRLKNSKEEVVYVDEKGNSFPMNTNFSYECILVMGDVQPSEYKTLVEFVNTINKDEFYKKYFIGIEKKNNSYYLFTIDGNFKVELGELSNVDFKLKGFKTFMDKILIREKMDKYSKISLKYNGQIVATRNKNAKMVDEEKEMIDKKEESKN